MTHLEVKAWLDANLERKMREFGVPHFRCKIFIESDHDEKKMEVTAQPDRERAYITVWVDRYQDDESPSLLESDLEHELMHVVHSPFSIPRLLVRSAFTEEQMEGFDEMWQTACEMTVRNMERMTFGVREAEKARATAEIEALTARGSEAAEVANV